MSEFVASLFAATDKPYRSTTSHPAMIRHRLRSMNWNCVRKPGMGPAKRPGTISKSRAAYRLTASFEYIGPANFDQAELLGVLDCRVSEKEDPPIRAVRYVKSPVNRLDR